MAVCSAAYASRCSVVPWTIWKSIDAGVGQRIEDKVRAGKAKKPAEGTGEG